MVSNRKKNKMSPVYLHTSSVEHDIESIDTDTYRMAEEKAHLKLAK